MTFSSYKDVNVITQCSGLARIQGISEKEAVECEPKLTQFFHPKSCQFTYRYYPCRPIQLSGSLGCNTLVYVVHPTVRLDDLQPLHIIFTTIPFLTIKQK